MRLKHGNTKKEESSKLSGGLRKMKHKFFISLVPPLRMLKPYIKRHVAMAAFICHNYLEVSFCNWLMINIHHLIFFSFLSTVVLLVFLTFLLLNRHLEKSLFKSLDWITSSMQNIQ